MPSEINYCDKCGGIIRPSAIEDGSAVVSSSAMLCPACLEGLPPEERKALSAPRAGARTPGAAPMNAPARVASGGRRPREVEGRRAAAPAGGSKVVTAVAVGIGAAVVSALLSMSLLGGSGSVTPGESPATAAVADPTGRFPAPSPPGAAHQLARIRAMIDAGESRYSEARGLLVEFPKSFAGTPEVEDARALLAEIDAEYAKRAEDELASAVKTANAEADLNTAVAQITSVGDRFRAGPWYAQTGQARIAEAIAQLRKGRAGLLGAVTGPDAASPAGTGSASAALVGVASRPATTAPADRPPGVYEPFDSQRSDSARGFDGPWQGGMGFADDSMPWGLLPVKGNRGKSVRDTRPWHTTSHRKIAPHALKDAGLLRDGTTLWISAVVPLSDYSLALGSSPFYFTRESDFFSNRRNLREGGQGIGFSHSNGGMQSTAWVDGRRRLGSGAKRASKNDTPGGTALVVLKVAWGSDGNPDRVQLFMPNEKLQPGEVVSEISADIDQESLECISYSGGVGTPIDEIRIGASYVDVMGNTAELRAAAEAEKKAAAEAEAEAKAKAVLAEFDRLMAERQYEAAQKHAESKMSEDGAKREELRTAARIARVLAEYPAAAVKGAKVLVGQQQPLKLVRGTVNVTIRAVSKEGLDITREFTINNQTQTKRSTMEWRELHPSQRAEFARLGGLKLGEAEAHIVEAYLSLAAGDTAGARESVEKATDHPLKAHFSELPSKSGK